MNAKQCTPETLYAENEALVWVVMSKHFRQYLFDDDMMQEARLALWRACLAYDPAKGKLSTIATKYIVNAVHRVHWLSQLPGRKPLEPVASLDEQALDGVGSELHELVSVQPDTGWVDSGSFLASLSAREREAVLRSYAGYSRLEIGERMGSSRQWASACLLSARKKFDKFI